MKIAALLFSVFLPSTLAFSPSNQPLSKPSLTTYTLKSNIVSLPQSDVYEKVEKNSNDVDPGPGSKASEEGKILRKKWGVDNEHACEYWSDARIHTLGNCGFWGAFHAAVAPISTLVIDVAAYNGVDVRKQLAKELSDIVGKQKARVVDLCCGVGFSTRALQHAFPDAETILGIDTSPEMVAMAQFITSHISNITPYFGQAAHRFSDSYNSMKSKGYAMRQNAYAMKQNVFFKATKFALSNAEDTKLPNKSFDLVTVMYAFHEAPLKGREKILREARRLLAPGGTLAVVDISTAYVPSSTMLRGEPYVQEYQQNIHRQLGTFRGFERARYKEIIPNQLGMWTLKRSVAA